jgi:hypothetical protein
VSVTNAARAGRTSAGARGGDRGDAEPGAPAETRRSTRTDDAAAGARPVEETLSLGWLSLLPLVAAYEIALALDPGAPRNTAEYVVTLPFQAFLPQPGFGRIALELVVTAIAVLRVFHAELGLVKRAARVAAEGFAAAIVLGPLLLGLLAVLDATPPAVGRPEAVTTPGAAALFAGGAAFEEIVFRVALLAGLGVLARTTFEWLLGSARLARVPAVIAALVGSAFLFAAAHLDVVVGLVASGGEPYDGARFAWRLLAGVLLAGLYLWRGFGVAAWCHAFFNLALALGAGPEVFA